MTDTAPQSGAPLHGPGGLLGTAGLGARRKGRKWGIRTKDKQIVGKLYRADNGKFSAGNGAPSSDAPPSFGKGAPTPKKPRKGRASAKPKQTPEQHAEATSAKRQQNADAVAKRMADSDTGLSPSGSSALLAFASGTPPSKEIATGLASMGLAEQASDGSYRMTPTGHAAVAAMQSGDYQRAVDAVSRGTDASGKRSQRQTERAQRQQAAAAKRAQTQARRAAVAARRAGKKPKGSSGDDIASAVQGLTHQASGKRKKKGPSKITRDRTAENNRRANLARLSPTARQALTGHADAPAAPAKARSASPPPPTKARTKAQTEHTGVMIALYPDAAAAKQIVAQKGVTEPVDNLHLTLAFLGDSSETPLASNKDRIIEAVKEWATTHGTALKGTINGLGRFFHSEDDNTNAVFVSPDVPGLPEMRQSLVDWIEQSGFDYAQNHGFTPHITVAYVPLNAPTPPIRIETPITFDHVTLAWGDEQYDYPLGETPATKAFAVFKDHTGAQRWIARTTTAYRDRDGEIISEAALDADSQRMMATKQFGPLRYWHIGQPDPLSDSAPWGPGVDIGTCDYSVVIGRTRIESGTFHSAQVARKMAAVADDHEMSPGFLYTPDQPDADGVFTSIRTFERSPVPRRYARAANLFTGFAVKEHTMEVPEMERRFKAMYQELGLTPEQGLELGQQLLTTEKAAQQQGVAFKESSAPEEITINGVVYAVKAAAPPVQMPPMNAPDAEDDPALGGDGGVDEAAEGEPPMDDAPEGDFLGDMSPDDFFGKLATMLAPVLKMQDMVKSIGDTHAELKGMYGGVAQKDAGTMAEITALKARLAQIEGDQPAVVNPAEVLEALKSAGPAATDPEQSEVVNDPSRPFAQIAARTMPNLYRTGPAGEFAGWTPPPVQP